MAKTLAQREIERLVSSQSAEVRKAFHAFVRKVKSPETNKYIISLLQSGDVDGALELVDSHVVTFSEVVPKVFKTSAGLEVKSAKARLGGGIAVGFNPGLPEAAEVMENSRLHLIREFGKTQRDVVRSVLTESLEAGEGPREAARKFRDAIGLTEYQNQVVSNYQESLEAGNKAALDYRLRDRRYDRLINRTVDEDLLLDGSQIERMVTSYRQSMLGYRAETIARTESHRVVNEARHEAWKQVAEAAGIPKGKIVRTWVATDDNRTRDTHSDADGQQVGMDEPFEMSSGALLMYPGDPEAPAEEVIHCRCNVLFDRE